MEAISQPSRGRLAAIPTGSDPAPQTPAPAPEASPSAERDTFRPQSRPAAPATYTVRPGDSLSDIARKHLGDPNRWHELYALNRDQLSNPSRLAVGMTLKLPGGSRHAKAESPSAARQTVEASCPKPQSQSQRPQLHRSLLAGLRNRFSGVVHHCFDYAWTTVQKAGGRSITAAQETHTGRNMPISHLNTLASQGKLKVGDVVYTSRRPGADPSSTVMAYGPHWFVYLGNDKFADQYGTRDAQAMQAFVPGRKIDSIFHPFKETREI
jgi:Tfp pilus assembly protein FimV